MDLKSGTNRVRKKHRKGKKPLQVQRCCVCSCTSTSSSNVSFHTYPSGERAKRKVRIITENGEEIIMNVLDAWRYQLVGTDKEYNIHRKVCSRHFVPDDFLKTGQYAVTMYRLKNYAVPSQYLPIVDRSKNESLTERKTFSEKLALLQSKESLALSAASTSSGLQMVNLQASNNEQAALVRNSIQEKMSVLSGIKNLPLVPSGIRGIVFEEQKILNQSAAISDSDDIQMITPDVQIPTEIIIADDVVPANIQPISISTAVTSSNTPPNIPTILKPISNEAFMSAAATNSNNIKVVPPNVPTTLKPISKEAFMSATATNSNNMRVIPTNVQIPAQTIVKPQPIPMSVVTNSNTASGIPANVQIPTPMIVKSESTTSEETFLTESHYSTSSLIFPKPPIQIENVVKVPIKTYTNKKGNKKTPIKLELKEPGTYHPPKEGKVNYRQKCIVPGCGSTCKTNRDRSFHNFPSSSRAQLKVLVKCANGDVVMDCLEAWLYKTQTSNLIKGDNYRSYEVCSKHFSSEDYVRTYGGMSRRLKASAVPTLNLPPEILTYSNTGCLPNTDSSNNQDMSNISANENSNYSQPDVILIKSSDDEIIEKIVQPKQPKRKRKEKHQTRDDTEDIPFEEDLKNKPKHKKNCKVKIPVTTSKKKPCKMLSAIEEMLHSEIKIEPEKIEDEEPQNQPDVLNFPSVFIKTEVEDPNDPLCCVSVEYDKPEETIVKPFESVYIMSDNVIVKQEPVEETCVELNEEDNTRIKPQNLKENSTKYRDTTRILRCYNCDLTFLTKEQQKQHKSDVCNKHRINLQCLYCEKIFYNTIQLNEHFYIDHNACKCCNILFKNIKELSNHIIEHNNGTIYFYTCLICSLEFKCIDLFTIHTTTIHKNKKAKFSPFKKYFGTDSSQHIGRPFKLPSCPYCNIFASYKDLPKHLEKFHDIVNCLNCNINFKQISTNGKYCRPCTIDRICASSGTSVSQTKLPPEYVGIESNSETSILNKGIITESNSMLETANMNQCIVNPVLETSNINQFNDNSEPQTSTNNDYQYYKPIEEIKIENLSNSETSENTGLNSTLLYSEIIENEIKNKAQDPFQSDVNIDAIKHSTERKRKNSNQMSLLIKRMPEKNNELNIKTSESILIQNKSELSVVTEVEITEESEIVVSEKDKNKDDITEDTDSNIVEKSMKMSDDESSSFGAIYTITVHKSDINKASTSQQNKSIITFPNPEQHICNDCKDIFSFKDYEKHKQNNDEGISIDDFCYLPCLYCLEMCRTANTLDSHIQVIHKACKICNISFENLAAFQRHEKKHLKGQLIQYFICLCGLEFKTLKEHESHVIESKTRNNYNVHNVIPIKCRNIFFQKLDKNNSSKILKSQCPYCNTILSNKLCVLRKHLRNIHGIYYCKICYKHFKGKHYDIVGLLDSCHSCNNRFFVADKIIESCKMSNKRSSDDSDDLDKVILKKYCHSKKLKLGNCLTNVYLVKPLECKNEDDADGKNEDHDTDGELEDSDNTNKEMELSNETYIISDPPITEKNECQNYCKLNEYDNCDNYCEICKTTFKNIVEYKLHIKLHDSINNYNSKGKCSICNEIFYNYCSFCIHFYKYHSKVKLPDPFIKNNKTGFKCPICHAIFKNKNIFFTHCVPYTLIETLSTDCSICKIKFTSFETLEFHYTIKHTKERINFACKICKNVMFEDMNILHTHVLEKHNQKMIHCSFCKTDFFAHDYSNNHIELCCKYKTKQCLFCDGNDHNSLDHDLEFEFLCDFCLNYFYSADNLKLHVENVHEKMCVVIDAE